MGNKEYVGGDTEISFKNQSERVKPTKTRNTHKFQKLLQSSKCPANLIIAELNILEKDYSINIQPNPGNKKANESILL